jgi:hypothetical protein
MGASSYRVVGCPVSTTNLVIDYRMKICEYDIHTTLNPQSPSHTFDIHPFRIWPLKSKSDIENIIQIRPFAIAAIHNGMFVLPPLPDQMSLASDASRKPPAVWTVSNTSRKP